jgi:hypothetical protein
MLRVAARDSLFENLHDSRRRSLGWFAHKQVDMLRHDNVPNQPKTVDVAHLAQNINKEIPGTGRGEQRHAPVTTARDEVQVPVSVPALQSFGHGKSKQEPRP